MPEPAQFAVVFHSQRNAQDPEGYAIAAARMEELARRQEGFVSLHSVRGADGKGITVSYWTTLEAIRKWAADGEHRVAQRQGRERWYDSYEIAIAKIERRTEFIAPGSNRELAGHHKPHP